MAYNPAQPIQIQVEIYVNGAWVDITTRGRGASCTIRQGRSANAIQAEGSRLDLEVGNPDGYLTEGNAMSPWYPYIGRGCPIRVSRLGLTVSPAQRFTGRIDSMTGRYPGGNRDATMQITAVGTLGTLGRGSDPLHSPLYRAMLGISEGDFQPIAYWSMEAGSGATQFDSSFSDQPPALVYGGVSAGAYSGIVGSEALPVLSDGGQIAAVLPSYTDTGIWQIQFTIMIPSSGFSANAALAIVEMLPGHPTSQVVISYIQATSALRIACFNSAGTVLDSADLPGIWNRDTPYQAAISDYTLFGDHYTALSLFDTSGTLVFQATAIPDGLGTGSPGQPYQFTGYATSVSSGWSMGHVALYTADVLSAPNVGPNAQAAGGYVGELAGDRLVRLFREEGIAFELVGDADDTEAMGPQLIDTLLANARDCENTDAGLMHDNGTDGAVVYVTRASLYNKSAGIAVVQGSLEPNLEPIWDNQYTANDVTSSRTDGGSSHVADEDHVARVGARYKDSRTPNVETDDQLRNDASWAVHIGTAPGARYNSVGINLRNPDGALLADSVADHAIGDRLTVATTALPPQHIDGIDGLTVGWTELLDSDTWKFRANLVPYSPYEVAVYDDTAARYDSQYTYTIEDLDTTETTIDVVTREGKLPWITSAAFASRFPLDAGVGGEKLSVTAIAALASDAYGRTVSNGWGTADSGQTYTVSGTAADYAVAAGVATQSNTAVNSLHSAVLDVGSTDVDFTWDCRLAIGSASGAEARHWLAGRWADANNYYLVVLALNTSAAITLAAGKRVAGVLSFLTSGATIATGHAGGETYRVRLQVMGTSIRARAWLSSDAEPSIWHAETTDSSLTSGTSIAALSRLETGNTNTLPISFVFDNLTLLTPQRWTVARSRNSVVKSHTSGAKVSLWDPAVYAY